MPLLSVFCVIFALSQFALIPAVNSDSPSSLPAALDRALVRSFGNRSGAGVVAEVSTGRILAAKNLSVAARRLALPGSSIKPFVLFALLESGRVRPEEPFVCPYKLEISGRRMDCTHPENTGPLYPASALAWSCNNFFAHFAPRLTPEELARALARWGFASATHLAAGEAAGEIIPARAPGELQLQALGVHGIHVTPLELLQAYRRLALRRRDPAAYGRSLGVVFAGLEASAAYGMSAAARTEGLSEAGKTGTSLADEGNWSHGWFAGYAPADAPEIVLVVFIEKGRGPTDAAGIAHDVFSAYRDARPRG
ncbi:MAG TPA: penicillin-binding transpeptidase domain-containing protein [Candidatus Acidoferrales bacterium]|nr:penicillin-binding transpeptidase domain-containing protein [Candidatus Acidoferrales bacterium]